MRDVVAHRLLVVFALYLILYQNYIAFLNAELSYILVFVVETSQCYSVINYMRCVVLLSLSTRRAWIEIAVCCYAPHTKCVALHTESVD